MSRLPPHRLGAPPRQRSPVRTFGPSPDAGADVPPRKLFSKSPPVRPSGWRRQRYLVAYDPHLHTGTDKVGGLASLSPRRRRRSASADDVSRGRRSRGTRSTPQSPPVARRYAPLVTDPARADGDAAAEAGGAAAPGESARTAPESGRTVPADADSPRAMTAPAAAGALRAKREMTSGSDEPPASALYCPDPVAQDSPLLDDTQPRGDAAASAADSAARRAESEPLLPLQIANLASSLPTSPASGGAAGGRQSPGNPSIASQGNAKSPARGSSAGRRPRSHTSPLWAKAKENLKTLVRMRSIASIGAQGLEVFDSEAELEAHINEASTRLLGRRTSGVPLKYLAKKVSSASMKEQRRREPARRGSRDSLEPSPTSDAGRSRGSDAGGCANLSMGSELTPPELDEHMLSFDVSGGDSVKPPTPYYSGPACTLFRDITPEAVGQMWSGAHSTCNLSPRGCGVTGSLGDWVAALNGLLEGQATERLLRRKEVEDALTALGSLCGEEPACVSLCVGPDDPPLTVVGDVHGQKWDLIGGALGPILRGERAAGQLLFLGDLVDRGPDSIDVVMIAALAKLCFPTRVHLLRGNHEDPGTNHIYGFFEECERRWPLRDRIGEGSGAVNPVWMHANFAFSKMPIAAVVESAAAGRRFFACHGGLCPQLMPVDSLDDTYRGGNRTVSGVQIMLCKSTHTVAEGAEEEEEAKEEPRVEDVINAVERGRYGNAMGDGMPPPEGTAAIMEGILWSDPADKQQGKMFQEGTRGVGWEWSPEATQAFCEHNDFDFIIRAHQCVQEGIEWSHGKLCATLFSAAAYLGNNNKGAVLHVGQDWGMQVEKYDSVPAPASASVPSDPPNKYFAEEAPPVSFPKDADLGALRSDFEKWKAAAVGEGRYDDAAELKRQLAALALPSSGGRWLVAAADGPAPPLAGHEIHFCLDGGTIVGRVEDDTLGDRLSVCIGGPELKLWHGAVVYECKLARDCASATGTWSTGDDGCSSPSARRLATASASGGYRLSRVA